MCWKNQDKKLDDKVETYLDYFSWSCLMFALRIAVSQVLANQYLEASLDWLAKLLAS